MTIGIYVKSTGTFYHMDYGNAEAPKATAVDRVVRTLIQRGIIEYDIGFDAGPTTYKVMTLDEANEMGAKIDRIHISTNTRDTVKEVPTKRKSAR